MNTPCFLAELALNSAATAQSNQLFRLGRVMRILRLFRLLRLTRFFRMGIFNKMSNHIQSLFVLSMAYTRLLKILLLTLLVAHLVGGFW